MRRVETIDDIIEALDNLIPIGAKTEEQIKMWAAMDTLIEVRRSIDSINYSTLSTGDECRGEDNLIAVFLCYYKMEIYWLFSDGVVRTTDKYGRGRRSVKGVI